MNEREKLQKELKEKLESVPDSYDNFVTIFFNVAVKAGREQDVIDFINNNEEATTPEFADLLLDMSESIKKKSSSEVKQ